MLINQELFYKVEQLVKEKGSIERFEEENGKITGRMMITICDIPDGVEVSKNPETKYIQAFCASFDFTDIMIGVAIDLESKTPVTGAWVVNDIEVDKNIVDEELVYFFLDTLIKYIEDDGSYGAPMYTFLNDNGSMTLVPC